MKRLNPLLKAFLAMGIAFAFSIALGQVSLANADILTVVNSVENTVSASPIGSFVPATTDYSAGFAHPHFPKKFMIPGKANDVFDIRESVEAIKAWLLREIVKGEGPDSTWIENLREELGAPAIRGEDVITILQKK